MTAQVKRKLKYVYEPVCGVAISISIYAATSIARDKLEINKNPNRQLKLRGIWLWINTLRMLNSNCKSNQINAIFMHSKTIENSNCAMQWHH